MFPESAGKCRICKFPVSLEACKIDENGCAVHEECYRRKIVQEQTDRDENEAQELLEQRKRA